MEHMTFYKTVPPEALDQHAEKLGLGSENPSDLVEIKKIIGEHKKLLEVGCGTGRLGKHFIEENYEYLGIDTNEEYLEAFKSSSGKEPNIEQLDFLDLAEDGQTFEVILFPWTVIGDFSRAHQEEALKKASRLLSDNGVIILDNPAPETGYNSAPGYEPEKFYFDEWKETLASLGFEPKKVEYATKTELKRELTVLRKLS